MFSRNAALSPLALSVLLTVGFATAGCAQKPKLLPARVEPTVPLGAGLNGEIDWSRDEAFVDMVKTTRGFYDVAGKNPAKADANGWPTEDFWVRVADTGAAVGAGIYKLSFTGPAGVTVDAGVSGATLTKTSDTDYDVSVPATATVLEFHFHNTQGQVKNVRVIRPGYDPVHPPLFTREYLALINARNPNLLRFMDWHSTNGNLEAEWSERSLPTDATQTSTLTKPEHVGWSPTPVSFSNGKGICWEYCLALANETNKDAWINVPVLASDDYVRHLAQLVKTTLKPNLRVYLEYSNEVWNDGFLQTGLNRDMAVAEVKAGGSNLNYDGTKPDDAVTLGDRRVAKRLKEIADVFGQVFGPDPTHARVRPVLAYQLSSYRFDNQLTYLEKNYGPPKQFLYGMAIAPYFACGNGQGADARKDLTKDDVLNALDASVNEYRDGTVLDDHATLAAFYGLKLCAYEGGPDTFGPNNVRAKKAASLDPRIKTIVQKYLDVWYSKGGDQFNWFVIGASNFDTQYGTWALTDDIRDLNQPKELGYDAVRTSPRPAVTIGAAVPGEVDARFALGRNNPTTDPFIRFIGAGAKFDYLVRVPQAGRYALRVSIAGEKPNTKLDVLVNDSPIATVDVPQIADNDNGEKFVDTAPIPVTLPTGLSVIRLHVPTERPYHVNSLKLTRSEGSGIAATLPTFGGFQFYWQETVAPGVPYSQSFTVNDDKTAPENLAVTARSDNATLVPDANVVLTRDPKNAHAFNFTVTPAAGQTGKVTITFTVKNAAGLTRSTSFQLTVK